MDPGPTSSAGEEEARAPLCPSPRKRKRWTVGHPSHWRRPRFRSPCSLLLTLSPPYLPPDTDPSLPLLRVKEEARAPPPPSPRKRRQRSARRSSRLRHCRCRSPRSSYSPPPSSPTPLATQSIPSAKMCVLFCVPHRLIVAFVLFRPRPFETGIDP